MKLGKVLSNEKELRKLTIGETCTILIHAGLAGEWGVFDKNKQYVVTLKRIIEPHEELTEEEVKQYYDVPLPKHLNHSTARFVFLHENTEDAHIIVPVKWQGQLHPALRVITGAMRPAGTRLEE